jgi:uncharacterized protein (TIGR02246 family)
MRIAALACLAALPLPAQTPSNEAVAAIAAANLRLMKALERSDAAAFAAQYAEDGVLLQTRQPEIRGRAAIHAFMARDLKGNPFKSFEISSLEQRSEGSLVIEVARFTATAVDALGSRSSITQRFLTVWKRQGDGAWRIQTQMGQVESRSPTPVPTPAPAPAPAPAAPKPPG